MPSRNKNNNKKNKKKTKQFNRSVSYREKKLNQKEEKIIKRTILILMLMKSNLKIKNIPKRRARKMHT